MRTYEAITVAQYDKLNSIPASAFGHAIAIAANSNLAKRHGCKEGDRIWNSNAKKCQAQRCEALWLATWDALTDPALTITITITKA